MNLEKRNEIINFIGWREINNTDTGNWRSSAGITRGNSRIRRKQSRNYIYLQEPINHSPIRQTFESGKLISKGKSIIKLVKF
jgi:hypothetical protein